MPTIKLISGSFRSGDKRYTPKSEPFEVSDKVAKLLHCSVVPSPKATPAPKASPPRPPARSVKGDTPKPSDKLTALRVQAMAMGLEVQPDWSVAKLETEIAAHGG